MKKIKTLIALLLTAILCLCLASCSLNFLKNKNENISSSTLQTDEVHTTTIPEPQLVTNDETQVSTTVKPLDSVTVTEKTTAKQTTTTPTKPSEPTTLHETTTQDAVTTTVPQSTTLAPNTSETTPVSDSEDVDFETAVINAVNEQRVANGLSPLSHSTELSKAANIRAKEISVIFSHTRPDGSFWFTVSPLAAGENMVKGYNTPDEMMQAWINGESYKEMLAKEYKTIGVGCYYDSNTDTYYWVQLFGK